MSGDGENEPPVQAAADQPAASDRLTWESWKAKALESRLIPGNVRVRPQMPERARCESFHWELRCVLSAGHPFGCHAISDLGVKYWWGIEVVDQDGQPLGTGVVSDDYGRMVVRLHHGTKP